MNNKKTNVMVNIWEHKTRKTLHINKLINSKPPYMVWGNEKYYMLKKSIWVCLN